MYFIFQIFVSVISFKFEKQKSAVNRSCRKHLLFVVNEPKCGEKPFTTRSQNSHKAFTKNNKAKRLVACLCPIPKSEEFQHKKLDPDFDQTDAVLGLAGEVI